jgi:hypothetical protein
MPPHLRATQQEAHEADDRWETIKAAENNCVEKDLLGDGVEFFAGEGEIDESDCTLDEYDAFFAVEAVLLEWWEVVHEEVLGDLKEDFVGEVE